MYNMRDVKIGSYTIIDEIGGGTEGDVYRALHEHTGAQVAMKKMKLTADSSEKVLRECLILQAVESVYLVQMKEVIRTKNDLYTVYKLYQKDLSSMIGNCHECEISRWAADMAKGILDLQFHNVLHRDLKPTNILLDENDRAVIADFGLAVLKPNNQGLGTLKYMPPELHEGRNYTKKSDVFSYGMILYELMTDREINRIDIEQKRFHFRNGLSEEAKDIVMKCLEINPLNRLSIEQVRDHPFVQRDIRRIMNSPMSFIDTNLFQSIHPERDCEISIVLDNFSIRSYPRSCDEEPVALNRQMAENSNREVQPVCELRPEYRFNSDTSLQQILQRERMTIQRNEEEKYIRDANLYLNSLYYTDSLHIPNLPYWVSFYIKHPVSDTARRISDAALSFSQELIDKVDLLNTEIVRILSRSPGFSSQREEAIQIIDRIHHHLKSSDDPLDSEVLNFILDIAIKLCSDDQQLKTKALDLKAALC